MDRQEKISGINSTIAILENRLPEFLKASTSDSAPYSDYLAAYKEVATCKLGITQSLIQLVELGALTADLAELRAELENWKTERRWAICEMKRENGAVRYVTYNYERR